MLRPFFKFTVSSLLLSSGKRWRKDNMSLFVCSDFVGIHKPWTVKGDRGGSTLLHKPYLVKVSMEGEGVKSTQKSVHVVYGWPFFCLLRFFFTMMTQMRWKRPFTLDKLMRKRGVHSLSKGLSVIFLHIWLFLLQGDS